MPLSCLINPLCRIGYCVIAGRYNRRATSPTSTTRASAIRRSTGCPHVSRPPRRLTWTAPSNADWPRLTCATASTRGLSRDGTARTLTCACVFQTSAVSILSESCRCLTSGGRRRIFHSNIMGTAGQCRTPQCTVRCIHSTASLLGIYQNITSSV